MPIRSMEREVGNTGPSREIDTAQNAPTKLFSARRTLVEIAHGVQERSLRLGAQDHYG